MSEERRHEPRKRTLRAAKIVYGDFRYVFDCVIRNASEEGLQLRCDHAMDIPRDFHIFDPGEQTLRKVEVVWRQEETIGVVFTSDPIDIYEKAGDPRYARFRFM